MKQPAGAMLEVPDMTRKTRKTQQMVACPRPLHPALQQRMFLPGFVTSAVATLLMERAGILAQLQYAWDLRSGTTRVITVGTACSGSELYMLTLDPLAEALSGHTGCHISFRHVWACELNEKKRAWIRAHFCPEFLFTDVVEVARGVAKDMLTGRLVPTPAVDVLISGFSCKDASRLNIHHRARLDVVDKGLCSTGSTFAAFLRLGAYTRT